MVEFGGTNEAAATTAGSYRTAGETESNNYGGFTVQ